MDDDSRLGIGQTEKGCEMSIDYMFDDYLEDAGLDRSAEVVPDHACQVFDGEVAKDVDSAKESSEFGPSIEQARDTVEKMLSGEI